MERLSTNYVFNRSLSGVMGARAELVDMYEQIASGRQINKASDDPVQAARILDYQRSISDIELAQRFAIVATNDLSNEEAVLSQVQGIGLRARTLILQASNGVQSADSRSLIATELNQILEQIAGLSNSKNVDGAFIFAGYLSDNPAYSFTRVGNDITAATYNGDSNSILKTVSPTLNIKVSHPGSEVFTNGVSVFDEIIQARDAMLAGNAPTNLASFDDAFDNVTKAITDVGARMNQVESAQEVNGLLSNSMQVGLAKIRDLDLPVAITHFTQLETTVTAINSTFARLSQVSLFDYIR